MIIILSLQLHVPLKNYGSWIPRKNFYLLGTQSEYENATQIVFHFPIWKFENPTQNAVLNLMMLMINRAASALTWSKLSTISALEKTSAFKNLASLIANLFYNAYFSQFSSDKLQLFVLHDPQGQVGWRKIATNPTALKKPMSK